MTGATTTSEQMSPHAMMAAAAVASQQFQQQPGAPPPDRNIVSGYDIEALVDATMGKAVMPTAPVYYDVLGMPLTRIVNIFAPPAIAGLLPGLPAGLQPGLPPRMISQPPPPPPNDNNDNGMMMMAMMKQEQDASLPPPPLSLSTAPGGLAAAVKKEEEDAKEPIVMTRVLVLLNMVQHEDLATAEDHAALTEEVREECAKYGQIQSLEIPRAPSSSSNDTKASAVGKIFLEYASVEEACKAKQALQGRQFGDAVVQVTPYSESEYLAGKLE